MKVQISEKYSIETAHPASHYGAGVLIDEESGQVYGPVDIFPTPIKKFFGSDAQASAGDVIVSTVRSRRFSREEVAQIRAWLSQDPSGNLLPSYEKLEKEWAEERENRDRENRI